MQKNTFGLDCRQSLDPPVQAKPRVLMTASPSCQGSGTGRTSVCLQSQPSGNGGSEVDGHPHLCSKFKASLVSEEREGKGREGEGRGRKLVVYAVSDSWPHSSWLATRKQVQKQAFLRGLLLGCPRVSTELEHPVWT